ncbi:hypothetical protein V5799_007737 [Amblyomma americanum]|uniref:Secreted protein n=1 Tax=Amblyomma americanum TaxID=6943 RepID=A0AAQ4FGI3_AMBAM
MRTNPSIVLLFATVLHAATAGSVPCFTITTPDFLTTDVTHCYENQPIDICTPFNENDTEKVRELINCTNFDTEYKVLALTYLLNDAVASTLPEEERNQSLSKAQFIAQWCATGNPLPTFLYNLTCEDYLGMVHVTCGKPVTFNVPDVNGLGECAQNNEIEQLCTEGQTFTVSLSTTVLYTLMIVT